MTVVVLCPECTQRLRLQKEKLGRMMQCPKCSHKFKAEAPAIVAEQSAPPENQRREPSPARNPVTSMMVDELLAEAAEKLKEPRRSPFYDMNFGLWLLCIVSWGIPILTIGGLIWLGMAAGWSN